LAAGFPAFESPAIVVGFDDIAPAARSSSAPSALKPSVQRQSVKFTFEPCPAPARAATGLLYRDGIMVYDEVPLCELTL
jgi:hypothetical protein